MYQLIVKEIWKWHFQCPPIELLIFTKCIYTSQLPNTVKEIHIYFEYFTLIQQLHHGDFFRNLKNDPKYHIQTLRAL